MIQPPRNTTTILLLANAFLMIGCASREREQALTVPPPGQDEAFGDRQTERTSEPIARDSASMRADDATPTEIYADVELLATCGMEAPTVYFEYDSANVRRAAQIELTELAECMERAPLADRRVEVIGHADERGSAQYNEGLGLRRATAVADQLVAHGLDRTRVRTRSRGEEGANDPPEWTDRRVVIRLQDSPPTE